MATLLLQAHALARGCGSSPDRGSSRGKLLAHQQQQQQQHRAPPVARSYRPRLHALCPLSPCCRRPSASGLPLRPTAGCRTPWPLSALWRGGRRSCGRSCTPTPTSCPTAPVRRAAWTGGRRCRRRVRRSLRARGHPPDAALSLLPSPLPATPARRLHVRAQPALPRGDHIPHRLWPRGLPLRAPAGPRQRAAGRQPRASAGPQPHASLVPEQQLEVAPRATAR